MKLTYENRMAVAGHRGDCYNYYENTKTAFEMAHREGADMIETDVRLSSDGYLVLIHDDTINRTTNGKGRVCEMTLEELRSLNAGDKLHPEQIPTLEELLSWAEPLNITLNLEIKEYYSEQTKERCEKCINDTLALVERYNMRHRVVINSFDAYVLEYVYKNYGDKYLLHGFYPYSEMFNVTIDPTEYLYCACIFANDKKEYYDFLISNGIEPWIGASVTQISKLEMCKKNGARLITTNNPADIIKKLSEME
ncbi:MAG: hypothetical protein IKA43_05985 [Clostridia bacterium]|nr:hypothetical protein [Clostridia bacterium]